MLSRPHLLFAGLLLIWLMCGPAMAATVTVGVGAGCNYPTIQAAINATAANGVDDTIRVTRSQSWSAQALTVGNFQALDIIGGYATCDQADNDGSYTTIDGSGGAAEPVFRITLANGSILRLRYLTIRGGDEDGAGYGGGIYFSGDGRLDIRDSNITANSAGYGGGIYARGTQVNAQLVIRDNVQISVNTARYSGGGVYVDGMRMYMYEPSSWIGFNKALGVFNPGSGALDGGYAGGLMVLSGDFAASADVASSGFGSGGPIVFNEARYGGGAAIVAHQQDATLRLYSTHANAPVRMQNNNAAVFGGAIYMQHGGTSGEFGSAVLKAQYAYLEYNSAPQGAALYLDGDGAGVPQNLVDFNSSDLSSVGALPCPYGIPCGGIIGNSAVDEQGNAQGGVIEAQNFARMRFDRMVMNDNSGRNLLRGDGAESGQLRFETHHVAMTGNAVSGYLLTTDNDDSDYGAIALHDTTIAGNDIGAASILNISNASSATGRLFRCILWQPGKTTLTLAGQPLDYLTNIASEVASLNAGPEAVVSDPRFIDPAHGDFRLRAASPAVDAATAVASDPRDLVNASRDIDLSVVANKRGPRDLGAWERSSVLPLVLNPYFADQDNLWSTDAVSDSWAWDSTQNAAGPTDSGSIKVSASNRPNLTRVTGLRQCIHLPGPGVYALNGWGRSGTGSTGNRDYVYLNWEYRAAGGEECTGGPPNASADLFLSNSNVWQKPVNPALIDVSPAEWTSTSSVTVTLVAVEFSSTVPSTATVGWFDGISLEPLLDDTIFEDGFEAL